MTPDRSPMTVDIALQILNDGTRREVLRQLISSDKTSVPVDDLAMAIYSSEQSTSKIDLHHHHLPKLAETGVIDWDRDSGTVHYQPSEPLEDILSTLSRHFDEAGPAVDKNLR